MARPRTSKIVAFLTVALSIGASACEPFDEPVGQGGYEIVGGAEAGNHDFQRTASLINMGSSQFHYQTQSGYTAIEPADGSGQHMCGGTWIGGGYVLTAAHCVYGIAPNPVAKAANGEPAVVIHRRKPPVELGTYDLNGDPNAPDSYMADLEPTIQSAEAVHIYPGYEALSELLMNDFLAGKITEDELENLGIGDGHIARDLAIIEIATPPTGIVPPKLLYAAAEVGDDAVFDLVGWHGSASQSGPAPLRTGTFEATAPQDSVVYAHSTTSGVYAWKGDSGSPWLYKIPVDLDTVLNVQVGVSSVATTTGSVWSPAFRLATARWIKCTIGAPAEFVDSIGQPVDVPCGSPTPTSTDDDDDFTSENPDCKDAVGGCDDTGGSGGGSTTSTDGGSNTAGKTNDMGGTGSIESYSPDGEGSGGACYGTLSCTGPSLDGYGTYYNPNSAILSGVNTTIASGCEYCYDGDCWGEGATLTCGPNGIEQL